MGAQGHDGLAVPGRVVLAREPAFSIGQLRIDPPTRQVRRGDESETLEPRVMQVLVALARAKGEIVTRDELIDTCWDGRAVGDDSINRVLSRIRRIAADIGGGSFAVETITKVGYRLTTRTVRPNEKRAEVGRDARISRRALVGGGAAIASIGIAGAAALWSGGSGSKEPLREAKSLYERAMAIRYDARASSNRQAISFLREAVRLSPEYGEAWGALALAYRTAINGEAPERVAGFEERLHEAVRNAERYDPGNGDAAVALLPSVSPFGRWLSHEPLFRSAVGRHPDHHAPYFLLGSLLMEVGRWTDAAEALQAAKLRNPFLPLIPYKLTVSLWSAGRITAAEQEIDRAMQIWPQHGAIWQTKLKILALTGRAREALALATDPAAIPLDTEDAPDQEGRLLYLRALATKSPQAADEAAQALVRTAREVELERISAALFLVTLGRIENALSMLEGVYLGEGEWAPRSVGRDSLSTHPLFQPHARPLWRERRFARILDTIGLEQYWRSSKTLPDHRR